MSLKYSIKFTKIGNKNNKAFFLKRFLDKEKIIKKAEKKNEKTDRIIKDRKLELFGHIFKKEKTERKKLEK